MKTPPNNPGFARFTTAMRDIVKVSKQEPQRRMSDEKRNTRNTPRLMTFVPRPRPISLATTRKTS